MADTLNHVRYPDVCVLLSGSDGNAFSILGRVCRALRQGGASNDDINQFLKEATGRDYDHLLRTTMRWVEVR